MVKIFQCQEKNIKDVRRFIPEGHKNSNDIGSDGNGTGNVAIGTDDVLH